MKIDRKETIRRKEVEKRSERGDYKLIIVERKEFYFTKKEEELESDRFSTSLSNHKRKFASLDNNSTISRVYQILHTYFDPVARFDSHRKLTRVYSHPRNPDNWCTPAFTTCATSLPMQPEIEPNAISRYTYEVNLCNAPRWAGQSMISSYQVEYFPW